MLSRVEKGVVSWLRRRGVSEMALTPALPYAKVSA